jgi:2-oxoglutarate ferredoxin oxidoreductase subunit gamma
MTHTTVFAGFGGQGLLFAAEVVAQAAMEAGRNVLWIPAYGPEMRGGTASCTVIASDDAIGSPVVDRYDRAVLLSGPSALKYLPRIEPGGIAIVDARLVPELTVPDGVRVMRVDCSGLAHVGGDERMTSVVGLGALMEATGDDAEPDLERALGAVIDAHHPGLLDGNVRALAAGRDAVREAHAAILA